MIGKLMNIRYQQISKTVHGEMEQNKQKSKKEKSNHHGENHHDEPIEHQETTVDISFNELSAWIKEINILECYSKNNLKFILIDEGNKIIIKLLDKNNHTLQEYLGVQFKHLYLQLKQDKADSQKGTILNVNC